MNEKEPTIQESAAAEVAAMQDTQTPKGIDEADIAVKVAAGLTREQAITVLKNQAAEDAAVAKAAKGKK
jgi:hypothetical protein